MATSDDDRRRMVQEQLRRRGIRDERVLAAMERVRREEFVPQGQRELAYADQALPIECRQTISQPFMVALMTESLELGGGERVLEIGTGSGYQTAVLAELAGKVYSIERHRALAEEARERLKRLGYGNVQLRVGDGSLGWPEAAPFDRVLITAAAPHWPPALWDQLAEGGLLVGPFGGPDSQVLQAVRKQPFGRTEIAGLTPCRFVPLVSD